MKSKLALSLNNHILYVALERHRLLHRFDELKSYVAFLDEPEDCLCEAFKSNEKVIEEMVSNLSQKKDEE